MSPGALEDAAAALRAGGVVAYPTEAVYGLGCDPLDEAAVLRILAIKRREVDQGVLLIADSIERLADFIEPFDEEVAARVLPTWPGPNTWIVPARPTVPAWITGRHTGIAVRVTAHPAAAALCRAAGMPLVSTSANRHGEPPARTAAEVRAALGAELDYVLDGECGGLEKPTAIRHALTGETVRAG